MPYFDTPTQIEYKFVGNSKIYCGIAFLDQIIDLETGDLIDFAEIILVETYDDWKPLSSF